MVCNHMAADMQGRRMRASAGSAAEEDPGGDEDAEFFRRYERSADAEEAAPAHMRPVDPTVNLAADQNDTFSGGFGLGHDPRKVPKPAGAVTVVAELDRVDHGLRTCSQSQALSCATVGTGLGGG